MVLVLDAVDRQRTAWRRDALRVLAEEKAACTDAPLLTFPLPAAWGIDLYLKDETGHPTGSLKHRLARSLILFGIANGDITERTTLVESSSGSTAVSEAYFARLLGLPFVAVVPRSISPAKPALIESYGGQCRFADDAAAAHDLARELGGQHDWHFLDQFGQASTVTDWRGDNIGQAIFDQLADERHPVPQWIVVGAGTGGTSATIGRYCRSTARATRLAVVDPEGSAFYNAWLTGRRDGTAAGSRIEGIGRPRVEGSFVPSVIDEMLRVDDADSVAAMRLLREVTGIAAGPSTGTNLVGALRLIAGMRARGERGSVVTLVCDSGDRYADTFYDDAWVAAAAIDLASAGTLDIG